MATTPPTEASAHPAALYPIVCDDDVVQFRHRVREAAVTAGLGEVCAPLTAGRTGVRLIVEDDGPGIPDVTLALTDGTSGAGGLGLGLPGTRRLVDAFELWSEVGVGTCVTVEKWAL